MATEARKQLRSQDPDLLNEINEYIDELKDHAQGDYDFVVKFLKQQFNTALGSNDAERAKFFSSVANQVEKRIGRIPFDFDLKTGREKEDFANFLKQKDAEDAQQRLQEKEFETQQELATQKEQKIIKEGASERGMLGSGIEKRQSDEAKQERKVNIEDPQKRTFAFQQALRDEDRRLGRVSSERNIQDITTSARRAGEDEQFNLQFGTEKAEKTLAERLADIRRTENQQIRSGLQLQTTSALDQF